MRTAWFGCPEPDGGFTKPEIVKIMAEFLMRTRVGDEVMIGGHKGAEEWLMLAASEPLQPFDGRTLILRPAWDDREYIQLRANNDVVCRADIVWGGGADADRENSAFASIPLRDRDMIAWAERVFFISLYPLEWNDAARPKAVRGDRVVGAVRYALRLNKYGGGTDLRQRPL